MLLWKYRVRVVIDDLELSRSNAPTANKRLPEFVFINDGFEVISVSLGVVILSLEWLTALTLPTRVVTDLVKGRGSRVDNEETDELNRGN